LKWDWGWLHLLLEVLNNSLSTWKKHHYNEQLLRNWLSIVQGRGCVPSVLWRNWDYPQNWVEMTIADLKNNVCYNQTWIMAQLSGQGVGCDRTPTEVFHDHSIDVKTFFPSLPLPWKVRLVLLYQRQWNLPYSNHDFMNCCYKWIILRLCLHEER
jgi:hypothetical protein